MAKTGTFLQRFSRFAAFAAGITGLVVLALAINPQKASADVCSVNGRSCYRGYFTNAYDGGPSVTQHNLFPAPALMGVHGVEAFIDQIRTRIGNCVQPNNDQDQTGATFIVLTMLGAPPGTPKSQACARWSEWNTLVRAYATAGLVDWDRVFAFGGINTRSTYTDVTWYPETGSALSIVFNNPDGGRPLYAIKKDCGNPIGVLDGLSWDYDLRPSITVTDASGAPLDGTVEPGQTMIFRYYIRNVGQTNSPPASCYGGGITHPGYFDTPDTPESGGTPLLLSCPRAFTKGTTTLVGGPETVTAGAGTTICRTLFVNRTAPNQNERGTELCVPVVSKPYLMSFGGDVSAGGNVEGAANCASNNVGASIVSWNKNTAGYAGAGVQYAATALGTIKEFATAQRSPAGGAAMPSGLAFANNTATGNKYGGSIGSVKCMKDYYADKPASLPSLPSASIGSIPSGDYFSNSSVTLSGGTINPSQKTTIYVNGDLFISSNVTYGGSWTFGTIPMFRVIVRGNIFIGNGVTRLDGTYIAQPLADLSAGYMYTCATDATPPFTPPTLTAGAFYNDCDTKLTVNGSIVARSIQFLRTIGTLNQSTTSETAASNNAAEVYKYGPAFWIAQPNRTETPDSGETKSYDAITSLPPVL